MQPIGCYPLYAVISTVAASGLTGRPPEKICGFSILAKGARGLDMGGVGMLANRHSVTLGPSAALNGSGDGDDATKLQQTIDAVFGSATTKPVNNEWMVEDALINAQKMKDCPTVQSGFYRNRFKLILDKLIAALLLVFLLPVLAIITGCIVVFGGGTSLIFRHRRIGKDGRPFACLKFRTMCANADAVLNDRLSSDADALAEWTATQKLRNDPRVYPFGRFLRTTSLDELPQLWNVIRGEMALVGPRPVTEDEMQRWYEPHGVAHAYRSVRPGITGLWQVSGRNDTTYDERLMLDRRYVDTLSLWQDVLILGHTFIAVIGGEGAR
jgi:exopolysaccharide production protein ExoY